MFQQPIGQQAVSAVTKVPETINRTAKNVAENVSTGLNNFSSTAISTSKTFLSSNSIIAKIAFIFLVLIAFVILLKLGINFIVWLLSPTKNPYLVKGLIPGSTNLTIAQDGVTSGSVTVRRSNNEVTGLEFTWSVWLNITGVPNSAGGYQHVFHKGDSIIPTDPNNAANYSPGLFLYRPTTSSESSPDNLHFVIFMSSFDTENKLYTIDIDNVPLKKWVHVAIRMQNTIMDVYVNGTLTQRFVFQGTVPRQTYGSVYVCQPVGSSANGFNGYLSDLRYFDHALSVFSINNIVNWGPNLTPSTAISGSMAGNGTFLSGLWYKGQY